MRRLANLGRLFWDFKRHGPIFGIEKCLIRAPDKAIKVRMEIDKIFIIRLRYKNIPARQSGHSNDSGLSYASLVPAIELSRSDLNVKRKIRIVS